MGAYRKDEPRGDADRSEVPDSLEAYVREGARPA